MTAKPPSVKDQHGHDHISPEVLTMDIFGTQVTFQVRSAETNGAYAILEMVVPVGGGWPRMHTHKSVETFQILEGKLEFTARRDGELVTFTASAGDIVHLPPEVPHAFSNISPSPASCQIVIAPGSMEGYFLDLGTPVDDDEPQMHKALDDQTLSVINRKYGVKFILS
jgi:quercetin dioxygenase-like cupin family protein